jgi:glycosyltransferase involved in cell wall biosynthesis
MESLSLCVPVIGTDIRGIRDLIDDATGRLVPVGDIDALASAMEWMAEHPDSRLRMGLLGRERMKATHDISVVLKSHELLYSNLLENRCVTSHLKAHA